MNTILDRLRRLLAGQPTNALGEDTRAAVNVSESPPVDADMAISDSSLTRLMVLIEQTNEGEYACEETLDLLDEYTELAASDQDAEAIMPLVKGHLEHCIDCSERYEALLKILEGSEA